MKTPLSACLAAILFTVAVPGRAHALTAAEIAGDYSGTSTSTLSDGRVVTGYASVSLRRNGKIFATMFDYDVGSGYKGRYQFITDGAIVGKISSGELAGFVTRDGKNLTLDLLIKTNYGAVIPQRITLTALP